MTHRGRRSTSELEALALVPPPERMRPPASLTPAARRVWRSTLASLVPDYFRPHDAPLLSSYCEACAMNAQAARTLAAEGLIKAGERHPAFVIFTASGATMACLATKLRLAPSSRMSKDVASTKANAVTAPGTRPPWSR